METIPVTQVDFTAVLPRFLSLYVMSFLTPRDLSSAAQVSWHWRILAEQVGLKSSIADFYQCAVDECLPVWPVSAQDCLWAGRCVRRGWFLPYTPGEREYGAWKNHYISCVSTLDWLTPREVAERYGTLDRRSTGPTEEQEERGIRQMIRDKLQDEKSEWKEVGGSEYHPSVLMSLMFSGLSLRTRRAWGSYTKPEGATGGSTQTGRPSSGLTFSSWPSFSRPPKTVGSPSLDKLTTSEAVSPTKVQATSLSRSVSANLHVFPDFYDTVS